MKLNYADAAASCRRKGGELATAEIEAKSFFLKGVMLKSGKTIITIRPEIECHQDAHKSKY